MSKFTKDVIRAGRFFVPHLNMWLDMDTQRMDGLVSQFSRMKIAGVNVPLTVDHSQAADDVRGGITRLYRDGETLMMECEVPDTDCEALLARCPNVSLELEKSVKDGNGDLYPEAITAVTITPKPVVPEQQPFQKIAAGRNGGEPYKIRLAVPANSADPGTVHRMTTAAFGPVQSKVSLGGVPYSDPEGGTDEPTEPRARGMLAMLLSKAEETFKGDPNVSEFLDRVIRGDLANGLWNSIVDKLPLNGTNADVKQVITDAIENLWNEDPPAPVDQLEQIFSGQAVTMSRNPAQAEDTPVSRMIDHAFSNR